MPSKTFTFHGTKLLTLLLLLNVFAALGRDRAFPVDRTKSQLPTLWIGRCVRVTDGDGIRVLTTRQELLKVWDCGGYFAQSLPPHWISVEIINLEDLPGAVERVLQSYLGRDPLPADFELRPINCEPLE